MTKPIDKEQEIRLQFLEEAREYLDTIESGLLGLGSNRRLELYRVDAMLRAAHSIKGGAAMMGYHALSPLAHRLEDFFKILQVRKTEAIDEETERLLLSSVDGMRQVVALHAQGSLVQEQWIAATINPLLDALQQRLGALQPEDNMTLLSEEAGQDMSVLLFETEVESCLQRLETLMGVPDSCCVLEEFLIAAQELDGLGEMLELKAFSSLCSSIQQHLEMSPQEQVNAIAKLALQQWRRSQALVLVGQVSTLPQELALSSSIADDVPSLDAFETLLATEDFTPEALSLPSPLAEIAVSSPAPETTQQESSENTIRVSVRHLEKLGDLFGELTIERNGLNLQLQNLRQLFSLLNQRVKVLEKSQHNLRSAYDKGNKSFFSAGEAKSSHPSLLLASSPLPQFDWLEMDRYNDAHLLFQDLMETIVQIHEVSNDLDLQLDQAQHTGRDLTHTSQRLQAELTQIRMRPFSDLVGRFPRALRDMSLKYGKQVDLKITGGTTLIERTILEVLSDPLLHLLRNAFDHGIEYAEVRMAQGKSSQGCIEISALHQGNRTVIRLSDDGAGIDLEKIRTQALSMGFPAADLANASQSDLLELIFRPGFSTSEQVTDLSGRGVGMDIVRTNLQQVGGQIQVNTKWGQGTTFTITVPLTLSVVRVLLVESAGLLLALPTNAIQEMLIPKQERILADEGREWLQWQEQKLPLVRLHQWFRFSSATPRSYSHASANINTPTALIVAQGSNLVALQVDRYWGEQEVTTRPIEESLPLPSGFTGCTILGDGRLVPLIDVSALLLGMEKLRSQSPQLSQSLKAPTSTPSAPQKPMLMVVDDSINVRRFLALTLEKAGYRVQQAKDGQEALEKLEDSLLPIRAVICDIEMPRLDGYGFLAQVKSHPTHQSLPVIMLTSRSGDKHRQIALNLGATAYFGKPFQEQDLLQALKDLAIGGK